ncbi:uncharacterized protein LOC130551391 [Triplophysa rosa]|uniref:uncharacterized protein LOC130551391 n=1 Tax=Triplophysa rosa TaxID=992332 RepID=UPI002545F23C|nr:uncharacterized protein LOC130551391 [Triplophysa rosa]
MANVPSLEICQTSEEGLCPSSLLEQSCEDLASEMSFPSLSRLRSPDSTEEDVMWRSNQTAASLANAPEVCTDVPLHQSEAPSATCEETLSDLIAGCFPEFFQLSDQTRDIKPVDTSNFYSGHQEAKHGHAQSIPTSPSIRDPQPYLPKDPSEIFPSPHQPYVTYHLTPHCPALVLDVTRANTPHFICVPQPNHTSSQLSINYTPLEANHSCPMHQATPPYPFTPSRVFPPHLCVLNSNQPTNAQRPSESLDTDQSWRAHMMTSSASLHENFSVWQRFCETAKEFYSRSPHVQALTCFFMFIKLEEEERRFIQHRFQTNKPRGQHLGLWENPEVTDALEVKDRSEVSDGSMR